MTDKQIIIHGVDVNRCMFFNEEYEEDDIQIKNFCEWQFVPCQEFDCAKCYFKNWKRKEQECEELKERLYVQAKEKVKYIFELDQLKQILTEIKEIAEANKKYIYVLPSYFAAGDSLEFSFEFTKNILQKISKCEVEDDNN